MRSNTNSKELDALTKNCKASLSGLSRMEGVDNKLMEVVNRDLKAAYSFIGRNAQYINFKDNDRERYTAEVPTPVTTELLSVPNVIKDFVTTDKYDKTGFIWWILISVLVDIAAFVFFSLVFSKKNNNV